MEPHILVSTLSRSDRKFLDLMRHGDNFFKIELLRPAKSYYQKALELNIDAEKVKQKIADCDRLLKFELKVIWVIVAITAISIIAYTVL